LKSNSSVRIPGGNLPDAPGLAKRAAGCQFSTEPVEEPMARVSAGLLPYRWRGDQLEVFLVHPGGPFWASKDDGAWSIAKGEIGTDEAPLSAARREFEEETGHSLAGEAIALAPVRQAGGKLVHAFAIAAEIDPAAIRSNRFTMEWPPRSGERRAFPEIDRAGWFGLEAGLRKILKSQIPLLEDLRLRLQS
jgi:predicted NUDIX family NTP pyrophosphohydrolase